MSTWTSFTQLTHTITPSTTYQPSQVCPASFGWMEVSTLLYVWLDHNIRFDLCYCRSFHFSNLIKISLVHWFITWVPIVIYILQTSTNMTIIQVTIELIFEITQKVHALSTNQNRLFLGKLESSWWSSLGQISQMNQAKRPLLVKFAYALESSVFRKRSCRLESTQMSHSEATRQRKLVKPQIKWWLLEHLFPTPAPTI